MEGKIRELREEIAEIEAMTLENFCDIYNCDNEQDSENIIADIESEIARIEVDREDEKWWDKWNYRELQWEASTGR